MTIVIVFMDARDFKKMRVNKGYSQTQLAREFGVTVQTVSRWERAAVDIPRLAEIALVSLKPRPKTKKGG